jgi:hypothetical protein
MLKTRWMTLPRLTGPPLKRQTLQVTLVRLFLCGSENVLMWLSCEGLLFSEPPSSKHRLRKTRPIPGPASPSDVLDRPEYNHNIPVPEIPDKLRRTGSAPVTPHRAPSAFGTPHSRSLSLRSVRSLPKLARGLGRWKKTEVAGWVWIDVKEKPPSPS